VRCWLGHWADPREAETGRRKLADTIATNLTGRVALVTGASSGLGASFAEVLARAGAKVVLAARRTDPMERMCREWAAEGLHVVAAPMDVTDEESTKNAFDIAERTFGTVDTIVANAGVNPEGSALNLKADDFSKALDVNVRGVFLTAREGARRLVAAGSRETGNGRVVIIASITAKLVSAGLAPYSATKAAVVQMSKVLAREWVRQGINVNTISPGYVRTDLNADWFASDLGKKQIAAFPRRRLMNISDLDFALLYLCSDQSRGVTGTDITIDDGQSL